MMKKLVKLGLTVAIILSNINLPVYAERLTDTNTKISNENYIVATSSHGFDIRAKGENNTEIKTTYNNYGYDFYIREFSESNTENIKSDFTNLNNPYWPNNGVLGGSVLDNKVNLDIDFTFVRNDSNVQIKYILKNTTEEPITIDFGFSADVMIGTNDKATVSTTNTGLKLEDKKKNLQFSLAFKNIGGIDATHYWFGSYAERYTHFFGQSNINTLIDIDSWFAVSWQKQTLKAGETKEYIALLGVGEVASEPVLNGQGFKVTVDDQGNLTISVGVKNDDGLKNTLYYELNDKPGELGSTTATGEEKQLSGTIDKATLDKLDSGLYDMELYVQNDKGLSSETGYFTLYKDKEGNITPIDANKFTKINVIKEQLVDAEKITDEDLKKEALAALDQAIKDIAKEENQSKTEEILSDVVTKVEVIETKSKAKEEIKAELDKVNDSNLTDDEKQIIKDILTKSEENILDSDSKVDVESLLNDTYRDVAAVNATKKLESIDIDGYYLESKTEAEQIIADAKEAFKKAENKEKVEELLKEAQDKVIAVKNKTYVHFVEPTENFTYQKDLEVSFVTSGNRNDNVVISYQDVSGNPIDIPVNAGSYKVIATVPDTDGYKGTFAEHRFTISQATPTYTVPENITAIYGETLDKVTLPDGFTFEAELTTYVGKVGTQSLKAMYTPDDSNYHVVNNILVDVKIAPKKITLQDLVAIDREYNGTTKVEFTGGTLVGLIEDDDVSFTEIKGLMVDANKGIDKPVILSDILLQGDDSSNYELEQPTGLMVNISPKQLTIENTKITEKTYDGKYKATVEIGDVKGIIGKDNVNITATGTFTDKNVGSSKEVTVEYICNNDNYLAPITEDVTGNIVLKELKVTPNKLSKFYGEQDEILTYEIEGEVESEKAAFKGQLIRVTGETIGTYKISQNDLMLEDNGSFLADNYRIVFDNNMVYEIKEYTNAEVAIAKEQPNEKEWYSLNSITLNAPDGYTIAKTNGVKDTFESSVSFEANEATKGIFTYYLRSNTGAITTVKTFIYNNDLSAPTVNITFEKKSATSFLNMMTFNLFFKETVDVIITGADTYSGVEKIEYQKVASDKNYDENGEWTTYTDKFAINANEKFKIYAKVTDNVGKSIISNSDNVVVYQDSVADTTSFGFVKTSESDVETSVKTNGNTVKEITIDDEVISASNYEASSENESSTIITFKASYLKTLTAGNKEIVISYDPLGENIDSSSNESQLPNTTKIDATIYEAIIDTTTKIQEVSYNGQIQSPSVPTATTKNSKKLTIMYKDMQGEYTLTNIPSYKDADTYTIEYKLIAEDHRDVTGEIEFRITPIQLTWSDGEVEDKVYDGTTTTTIAIEPSLVGVIKTDTTPTITLGSVVFENKDVGEQNIVVKDYKMSKDVNYLKPVEQPIFKTAEIKTRSLEITPDAFDKYYGEKDDVLTYTYMGNLENETPNFTGVLTRIVGEAIESYNVSQGTLKLEDKNAFLADNYQITFVDTVNYEIKEYTTDEIATPTKKANDNGWYSDETITLNAPDGFTIYPTNQVDDIFESTLVITTEEVEGKEVVYYLRNEEGAISTAKTFVYNNDVTAPVINGVEHLKFYKDHLDISVSDINLDKVTLNDKVKKYTFNIKVNDKESYTLTAIDKAGNKTIIKFETYKDFSIVDDVINSLPSDDELSKDDTLRINNLVDEMISNLEKVPDKEDELLVNILNKLEDSFVKVNGNIHVIYSQPVVDENIEVDKRVDVTDIKPQGLAVAVYGKEEMMTNDKIDLSLSVKQLPSETDTLAFDVKPLRSINGAEAEIIPNHEIHSPVSFILYLHSGFKGSVAKIEHKKSENQSDFYENHPVLIDDEGRKYIKLTVSEFSNFVVNEYSYKVTIDGSTNWYKPTEIVNMPTPKKKVGYDFIGWISDDVAIEQNRFTMIERDVVINSGWYSLPKVPLTGDMQNSSGFIFLMISSLLGCIYILRKKIKENNHL